MADKTPPAKDAKREQSREQRLKAALKANLGRRKAQARARDGAGADKAGKSEEQS